MRSLILGITLLAIACDGSSPEQQAEPATAPAQPPPSQISPATDERLVNADAEPGNWLLHGRTYSEQRYSPLTQINKDTLQNLSLAWYWDTGTTRGLEATPIVADGVMYSTGTWSVVYAHDAASGELLWKFDPEVSRLKGYDACCDVVNRGPALWEDKVIVGALDGRLIALNATDGSVAWSVQTTDPDKPYTITGAPRVFNGKVVIGNGGAELGVRGYVTAYDAASGEQAWRFYTVPGNPDEPFEHPEMEEAAKTWRGGKWWEVGGGGTVWDSIVFDPELNLLYLGVGNGAPWSRYLRSPGGGDNLYLAAIVALHADSGRMAWFYQTTPGDNWDYTAVQQMMLADIELNGELRQVIMQAPKNGFFYVIDRKTGELLSADAYVPITWASHVDPETGRPVELPAAHYIDDSRVVSPGPAGGHNWHPMAFNPDTGLVYMSTVENRLVYTQEKDFQYNPQTWNTAIDFKPNRDLDDGFVELTKLVAWDPAAGAARWTVEYPHSGASGVLATAADLVFQPGSDCQFRAFDAVNGDELWSSAYQMSGMTAPVTYEANGEQYIAFLAGWGGAAGLYGKVPCSDGKRATTGRILAYKLGGTAQLPPTSDPAPVFEPPARLSADADTLALGERLYLRHCSFCHVLTHESAGVLPNLAEISNESHQLWDAIVLGGARQDKGMVSFASMLSTDDARAIQTFVIDEAHQAWQKRRELESAGAGD